VILDHLAIENLESDRQGRRGRFVIYIHFFDIRIVAEESNQVLILS